METDIIIIGSSKLQNELLAWFLENTIGFRCDSVLNIDFSFPGNLKNCRLILLDCKNNAIDPDCNNSFLSSPFSKNQYPVALFNVKPKHKINKNIFRHNVRGIFFEHEPLQMLPKGIQTIINGDLWFSRAFMASCLLETDNDINSAGNPTICLTPREKTILNLVTLGNSNKEIGETLKISPNTVKTHLHNIFKKINVSNRIQATLWAVQNL